MIALQKHLCGCGLLLTKMPPCSYDCVIKRKGTDAKPDAPWCPHGTYRIVSVKHGKGSGPREVSGNNCQNRRKGWDCNKAYQARGSGSQQTLPSSCHDGPPLCHCATHCETSAQHLYPFSSLLYFCPTWQYLQLRMQLWQQNLVRIDTRTVPVCSTLQRTPTPRLLDLLPPPQC